VYNRLPIGDRATNQLDSAKPVDKRGKRPHFQFRTSSHSQTTRNMDRPTTARTARYGACSGCRRSKVKCLPRPDDTSSCRRCAELGESCEFEPHRKGRTHTKRPRPESVEPVRTITTSRHTDRHGPLNSTPSVAHASDSRRHTRDGQQWPPVRSSPYVVIHSMTGPRDWFISSSRSIYAVPYPDQLTTHDPIARGIITTKDSERLFKRWV
jgi:hypothetical protein